MEYIFEIGAFKLRWYSTLIAIGLMVGAYVAARDAKRRGENHDHAYNILLLALPLSLIGARIYHVIHKWNDIYRDDWVRIFLLNEGGIGIYGAIAGSILAVFIYTRWQKLSFIKWLDIGAPGMIVGQAIGRWGNFFNQELYGRPTSLPWSISIPVDKRIPGFDAFSNFHPLFLYESLLNLLAFGTMIYAARRFGDKLKDGDIVLMYGLFYGAIRLGLENLRIGNWVAGPGLPVATMLSLVAVVGCGGMLLYRHWVGPKLAARSMGESG